MMVQYSAQSLVVHDGTVRRVWSCMMGQCAEFGRGYGHYHGHGQQEHEHEHGHENRPSTMNYLLLDYRLSDQFFGSYYSIQSEYRLADRHMRAASGQSDIAFKAQTIGLSDIVC